MTQKSALKRRSITQKPAQSSPASLRTLSALLLVALTFESAAGFQGSSRSGTSAYGTTRNHCTVLAYRGGDEMTTNHKTASWWNPFPVKEAPVVDKTQASVDDYLEFLERRYNRLHDEGSSEVKFSAWKWLKQEEEAAPTEQHDDALYALGVAGLASQRLLQKHQAAQLAAQRQELEAAEMQANGFTDVEAVEIVETPSKPSNTALVTVIRARLSPILRKLSLQHKLLLRYESQKMNAIVAIIAKTLLAGPIKATKALWRMGGGKKNILLTATLAAYVMIVLVRPLAQTIVSEGRA